MHSPNRVGVKLVRVQKSSRRVPKEESLLESYFPQHTHFNSIPLHPMLDYNSIETLHLKLGEADKFFEDFMHTDKRQRLGPPNWKILLESKFETAVTSNKHVEKLRQEIRKTLNFKRIGGTRKLGQFREIISGAIQLGLIKPPTKEKKLFDVSISQSNENLTLNVRKRISLKSHPLVIDSIKQWWDATCKIQTKKTHISKQSYLSLVAAIYYVIAPKSLNYTIDDMKYLAELDWDKDSKGNNQMDFSSFFDFVFEIADFFCESTKLEEYFSFLQFTFFKIFGATNLPKSIQKHIENYFIEFALLLSDESKRVEYLKGTMKRVEEHKPISSPLAIQHYNESSHHSNLGNTILKIRALSPTHNEVRVNSPEASVEPTVFMDQSMKTKFNSFNVSLSSFTHSKNIFSREEKNATLLKQFQGRLATLRLLQRLFTLFQNNDNCKIEGTITLRIIKILGTGEYTSIPQEILNILREDDVYNKLFNQKPATHYQQRRKTATLSRRSNTATNTKTIKIQQETIEDSGWDMVYNQVKNYLIYNKMVDNSKLMLPHSVPIEHIQDKYTKFLHDQGKSQPLFDSKPATLDTVVIDDCSSFHSEDSWHISLPKFEEVSSKPVNFHHLTHKVSTLESQEIVTSVENKFLIHSPKETNPRKDWLPLK